MKVTKDTVTISELRKGVCGPKGQTVQLKDADPDELQLFIDKMPATIKGKSVEYRFWNLLYVRKFRNREPKLMTRVVSLVFWIYKHIVKPVHMYE